MPMQDDCILSHNKPVEPYSQGTKRFDYVLSALLASSWRTATKLVLPLPVSIQLNYAIGLVGS
jgi:hypothetical protein